MPSLPSIRQRIAPATRVVVVEGGTGLGRQFRFQSKHPHRVQIPRKASLELCPDDSQARPSKDGPKLGFFPVVLLAARPSSCKEDRLCLEAEYHTGPCKPRLTL